jgi:uncharacterized protein YbjQ (UPF0145 family)
VDTQVNLYLILALVIAWGASVGGSFFYGEGIGKDGEIAGQAKIKQAIDDTREKAQQGAANAIAQIRITNTTVRGQTETIVRDKVVYRDCVNDPGVVRNINAALTGRPEPVGSVGVPEADGAKRP